MLPGALRCIPLVNSYNGLSTVSLAACNCLGAACRRVQAVTASAYCITQRSPATSNPCSTEDRTIRRSSVVQLVQMRALPATSLQVHRLRPRYSAVCSTHVTGTAIQIQTQPAAAAAADPTAVVSQILDLTANTDGGIDMQQQQRQQVDSLLEQLESMGSQQQPRPLDNPLLYGHYNVAYTSSSRAQSERGQPAGGRFRGSIGRALFKTTGVYQSVLEPDIATNKVSFKLFGLLPGAVGLRGRVVPVPAGQPHGPGTAGERDTVRVLFEPPVLSLGESLHFRIGPPSSVQLSTPYLDERVRLGKGSRGSLFVFTRGGAADQAGMAEVGLQQTTPSGWAWLTAAFAAMAAGGWTLWGTGAAVFQVLAGVMWLITAALAVVVWQGGVVRDAEDVKRTQELQLQIIEKQQKQRQQQQQQQQQQQSVPDQQGGSAAAPAAA